MAKGPYVENLGGKLNSNTPAQPAAAALEDQEQAEHEAVNEQTQPREDGSAALPSSGGRSGKGGASGGGRSRH
jgi:hypothetical protein